MKLYFRKRKQGAFAFRLDVENRQRRLEMIQIATINGKGEIRAQKRNPPTDAEHAEIEQWIAAQEADAEETDAEAFVREINLIAHWVSREADDEEILTASDPLLLAIHDLRQIIVRRLSKVGEQRAGNE
ncbi:MAG: hypothetical protein AAGD47_11030 [Pseudomonadota bacterium]